jgi:hypothetical protein
MAPRVLPDRQWDTMMTQFRMQTDQMTSQFNHLSVQLGTEASTPRPLTPSNIQPPPGTAAPPEVDTVSEDSVHEADNPAWLHGRPMTGPPSYQPPVVGARSIRYTPVAAVTPQTTTAPPYTAPISSSRSLFGGSQSGRSYNGNGAPYGPRRTHEYLSGYYWEDGMTPASSVSVPWLKLSLQGPYDGKSEKLQKAPLALADDSLTGFIQFYNVL